MKIFWTIMLVLVLSTITMTAHAQSAMPAVTLFMYDRFYEVFLRDYFRFNEAKPLRIEYWYENWPNVKSDVDEYRDRLHIEGAIPFYSGEKLLVDVPFHYSRVPIWVETEDYTFGGNLSFVTPSLLARWRITDRLKSVFGWEYNIKGDGEMIGKASGRKICLLKSVFSYDLTAQLNIAAGARLDRYYYDTSEELDVDDKPDSFRLARRLYCRPTAMLNWHPNANFTVLLGIPDAGVRLILGDRLMAEARAAINKRIELALEIEPVERIRTTLRFLNLPYNEVPIKSTTFQENNSPSERLNYTNKSIILEVGWELNPASLASLGLRYSPASSVEFKDRDYEDVIENIDSKPSYAIGATFTVDIEALLGRQ